MFDTIKLSLLQQMLNMIFVMHKMIYIQNYHEIIFNLIFKNIQVLVYEYSPVKYTPIVPF